MTSTLHPGLNNLVKVIFKEYYERATLELPYDMELREFAYQPFESESYVRHLSFSNEVELKAYLAKNVPLHLYYSSAKYQLPSAKEMEEKGWMGADIQFDLDADHFCNVKKFNFCPTCGQAVEGDVCPRDGTQAIEYVEVTKECIEKTKEKAIDLVEILEDDFGFKPKVYFSGNRGFHVIVECSGDCALLSSSDRKQIAEYVMEINVPKYRGEPGDPGWVGRQARGKSGVEIDEQVTTDVKRLVRIPGSIHGKSGLLVRRVELEKFEFSKEALSPLKGTGILMPFVSGEFELIGEKVKLREKTPIRLDIALALYASLKGLGELKIYEKG
ncbi:MAG: DNA primase small subunit PriS [Candidatus Aramenus sulfurataquae]|uniref:DNA primase small subunit PriS n=2 Tax=Candidatus Aramenus sulfurataquae TaxID=1326980 RepID=A0A0F2LMG3_9CREN|nr:DNA primase small subunit PriS [Candidatus Aramenus sulfurataquae]